MISGIGVAIGKSNNQDSRSQIYHVEVVRLFKRIFLSLLVLGLVIGVTTQKKALLGLIDQPISKLIVEGKLNHLTNTDISQALKGVVGSGFFNADLTAIKNAVELLPWVETVTVTRIWPGQIKLDIKEQVAASYWNDDGFINAKGEIFKPTNISATMALPRLIGVSGNKTKLRVNMLSKFDLIDKEMKLFGLKVEKLELKPRGVWEMVLKHDAFESGISVALGSIYEDIKGSGQTLAEKLERIGKILTAKDKIDESKIEKIDARYPNGVAIKWKNDVRVAISKSNS